MPRVIVHPGRRTEAVHELPSGRTSIGRGRGNDIRISDKSLSREHALLEVDRDGVVWLRDVGSKNGTYLAGEAIGDRRRLDDGDRFHCGDVAFVYSAAESGVIIPDSIVHEISSEASRALVSQLLTRVPDGPANSVQARRALPQNAHGRLQVLLEVARLLASARDVDSQLQKIVELALSIFDSDRAAVILLDSDGRDFDGPVVESRRAGTELSGPGGYSRHILNYVRERSVAALFSDASEDPRLAGADSVHGTRVRASMCAPLQPDREVIGVLYVDNLSRPAAFSEADLELLSAFAAQAAIAIDHARLSQRLREEAVARTNLLRFFPPTTVAQLLRNPELTGEVRETEVTALFCDISGFSRLAAELPPVELMDVLNRYFPVITEIVFRHEGTLEKYIGDALLAVWGAPFRRSDDTRRAVTAAVEMQVAVAELRRQSGRALAVHIGINSGPVAAGNLGSPSFMQYATIGDATNLASRICDLAGPGEIALSAKTVAQLGDPSPWTLDGPERRSVKGRQAAVEVYKLRWRQDQGPATK